MMKEKIDLAAARRCAVAASGLGGLDEGGADCLGAIRRLGSIQIDTISVVERAHHHILWPRAQAYAPAHLEELETEPRRIIEYWSHAAAFLPIEDYRFGIPRMERVKANGHDWFQADPGAIKFVLERIAAEGPLRVQDFERGGKKRAGWWDWKPAKVALEYLFHAGELVSLRRQGFQKVYELASRGLPPGLDLRRPGMEELAAHHVDRAVDSLGVFAADEVAYLRKEGREGIAAELAARLEAGRLVELVIDGAASESGRSNQRRKYYAAPSSLESPRLPATAFPGRGRNRAFILSPFDPLIIDRRRTARLFGLDYQLECYV
ncbi:MAG TPA: crosslink repair DNA glycosylase YcaQ family protein, partial [Rectinemataceae bacterium]|nr:crosslink repair DNA glycosylase YcaQ family protein [Rectinemataceae bacterium]